MTRRVVLVRHTEVARSWRGRCYGISDMGLSLAGLKGARALVDAWDVPDVDLIVHSGLRRAAILAVMLSRRIGVGLVADVDWRERDFGSWEGRTWHSIWRETGAEMDGMTTNPGSFRPGGGETTDELIARSRRAWSRLPAVGCIAVVSHGGPIAAIRSVHQGGITSEISACVPPLGSMTIVARDGHGDPRA